MKPINEVIALVVDRGLFCEAAIRLSRDMKKVYYHVPNDGEPFPVWNPSMIGYGMDGIERVDSVFGDHFDSIDIFFFPDCGMGPLQDYLVSIGKKVWGSRSGSELENDRLYCKELLKHAGLPMGPHKAIKGLKNLREWLKTHKDQYVKVSHWRGTTESFFSPNYKNVEPHLDDMELDLGPLKSLMVFDVEDSLPDKAEVGTDSWCVDGKIPKTRSFGLEIKDACYVTKFQKASDAPAPLQRTDSDLAGIMKEFGYRGFFSTEVRVGKDQKPYLIDVTARMGAPPGFLLMEMLDNFSDIVWRGANGELVEPEFKHAYGAEIEIESPSANERRWQPVEFDPQFRRQIKMIMPCRIEGRFYCAPGMFGTPSAVSSIGTGDTIDQAVKSAIKAAESVDGYLLSFNASILDKAMEACADAKAMGIDLHIS